MQLWLSWYSSSNIRVKFMTRVEYYVLYSAYPPNSYIVLDKATTWGLPVNTIGKVVSINKDFDTILVEFTNGDRRSLIYGEDIFHRNIKELYRCIENRRDDYEHYY